MRNPVAPHAGAWIETCRRRSTRNRFSSHPMRVRGLKLGMNLLIRKRLAVAPHAGAWIETSRGQRDRIGQTVAPHAGAWIETNRDCPKAQQRLSHPMRVRGLKHPYAGCSNCCFQSHPMRVRWLKCKLLYSVGEFVLALHSR